MANNTELELYPDEKNQIISAWAAIQRKYAGMEDTQQNLATMAKEAQDRFRDLGFHVVVDVSGLDVADDGTLVRTPTISIESRVVPEVFGHDHERHAVEIQEGFADGVPGALTPDGKLIDRTGKPL